MSSAQTRHRRRRRARYAPPAPRCAVALRTHTHLPPFPSSRSHLSPDTTQNSLTKRRTAVADELQVPQRLLMGPGPANADPRILAAQAMPLLGHMHPPFLKIMGEGYEMR